MAGTNLPDNVVKLLKQAREILDQAAKQRIAEAGKLESIFGKNEVDSDAYRYRREADVFSRFSSRLDEDTSRADVEMGRVASEVESKKGNVERKSG